MSAIQTFELHGLKNACITMVGSKTYVIKLYVSIAEILIIVFKKYQLLKYPMCLKNRNG